MTTHTQAIPPPGDEEVQDLDELSEVLPASFSITSYGADYPVDGLVKRLASGDIVVPLFRVAPEEGQTTVGFQRELVWKKSQADRFIESLLLGLPVPSIFLVKEPNGKFLVLDGQQRLRTLESFYAGLFKGIEFKLEEVQSKWAGKTYKTLHPDDRRRLDNSILHAIVVRQDEPSEDQSSIYLIFERLNSGGTILQPQEIRVALYHGPFATLLSELNNNMDWRALYGPKSARLKDIELLLRFLGLYFHRASYERPMKSFLNRYMAANRSLQKQGENVIRPLFENTVHAIRTGIGEKAFRPFGTAVNAAVMDALLYGVASRLASGAIMSPTNLKGSHEALLKDTKFLAAVTKATADVENVKIRLDAAKKAFADAK
ncbi:MAG: DUF262 domain-containing protein [Nitrospira sp.]|nr:DUF262 domain-containing protein [Nitrospira sp.]HMY56280.1 DUF262 domain-containing protein [Candidatus Obscuribacter sp.]